MDGCILGRISTVHQHKLILGRLMVLIEEEYLYILFSIFIIEMEIKM